jgi:Holliday junction resolvasome RuvABC endonuclease subunit
MDVLGIDPSLTATGLAKTTESTVVLTHRVTTMPATELGAIRQRIRYVVGQTLKFAPAECITIIEAPIVTRNGRGGQQLERAWLFGFLVDQLMQRGPVIQVSPRTRAKYGSGNGNADKKTVLAAVRATFPSLRIVDDNVADALALLSMGARWKGEPIDGAPSKAQLAAMTSVRWPSLEGMPA